MEKLLYKLRNFLRAIDRTTIQLCSVLGSRRGAECVREGGGVWLDTGTGGNAAYFQESHLPAALHVGKIVLVLP